MSSKDCRAGAEVQPPGFSGKRLELATACAFDVALLDLGLPVMDGFELARRLQELRVAKAPVLVAITGYGEEADRLKTREAGFEAHLVKPVEIDQVLAAIRQVEHRLGLERLGCAGRG